MSKEKHFSQEGKKVDHIVEVNEKVKKPEVGDVWEYMDGTNVLVVNVYNKEIDCLYTWKDKLMYFDSFNKKDFVRLAKYLGKSKVNVKELFDVKD